jgi:hypothetical protein
LSCVFGTDAFCAAAFPSIPPVATIAVMATMIHNLFVRLSMMDSLELLNATATTSANVADEAL